MSARVLDAWCEQEKIGATILGPAHPSVHRIERYELRQIVIKAQTLQALHAVVRRAQSVDVKSDLFVVIT